ncbi:MAG: hypothetical protein KGQ66_11390 [Acidobacteriota bacterium]|nr:hypothetical protein [Acidobacteriota bacterium]
MTGFSAATALAVAASAAFLVRLLPQPLRTLRTGHVAGVSALAAMNAGIADLAWLTYGLDRHLPAVWLVSIPALATSTWTVLLLRRAVRRADLALAGLWLAAIALSAVAGILTVALAAGVLVCCGPAVYSAYTSSRPVGLSRWTWWLAVVDAGSWGAYGWVVGDRALELYGVVMLATAAAVLARIRRLPTASSGALT